MPEICRAMPNPQRVEVWIQHNGHVPIGMRVGWNCSVPYCGKPEHMQLAENKNSGKMNWKSYSAAIAALDYGESVTFPEYKNTEEAIRNFRCGVSARIPLVRYSVRATATGFFGIKVTRTGLFPGLRNNFERVDPGPRLPLLMTFSMGVYLNCAMCDKPFLCYPSQSDERKYCSHACAGTAKFKPMLHNALESGAFFLGFLWNTARAFSKPKKCEMLGCIFPSQQGKKLCHRHEHFFDYNMSMEGRGVDLDDLFPADGQKHAPLTSLHGGEIKTSHERTRFINNGYEDKSWQLTDAFLLEAAAKAVSEKERSELLSFVRVIPDAKVAYVPEDTVVNYQGRGTRGGHPGGHKKIRKSQRKRPDGWHGSRPKHDVYKRWSRETIEAIECDYDDFDNDGELVTIEIESCGE